MTFKKRRSKSGIDSSICVKEKVDMMGGRTKTYGNVTSHIEKVVLVAISLLCKDMLRLVTNITIAAVQFLQGRYTVVSIACMYAAVF